MIVLDLPIPPSANALFFNRRKGQKGKGRGITRAYKKWLHQADMRLLLDRSWRQAPKVTAGYELAIKLPPGRGDISNRIKAVEDYLVSREITPDDKHNRKVTIERDPSLSDCRVTITPAEVA